jgi:hypothetical protein
MRIFIYIMLILMPIFSVMAITDCQEQKQELYSEFVPTHFDKGRTTVGADEIDPVKLKIENFIISNQDLLLTDISVHSYSSRAPFFMSKTQLDPKSDEKNFILAQERSVFVEKALQELKKSRSELSETIIRTQSSLAGPAFERMDLNTRFVTRMTPGFEEKIKSLFIENKELFKQEALISSADMLLNEQKYVNYYQAKFKPFQGFKISIYGYKKDQLKCSESFSLKNKKVPNAKGTKQ